MPNLRTIILPAARRVDLVVALILVVGTLLLLLPYVEVTMRTLRGDQGMGADELTFLANADRVRRGEILYRDVFEFRGPFGLALPLVAFLIAEPGVVTGRIAMIVFVALWTGLMYGTARRIGAGRIAGVMAALFVPFFVWPTWPYAYFDFVAQGFLCGALFLGAGARPGRAWSWRLAGACLAGALWTNVGQGLPVIFAFCGAAAVVGYVSGTARDAGIVVRDVFVGVLSVSAMVLLGLLATGALGPALRSIFVFPFQSYHRSPYNVTAYGVDRAWFPGRWRAEGNFAAFASKVIVETAVALPRVSVVVSLLVALALAVLAARRLLQGPSPTVPADRPHLRWIGLTASLAAASVPVFLNLTRSDLCHLGFVEATSFLAIVGLVLNAGVAPWSRWGRRTMALVVWSRRMLGVAAALGLAVAAAFTVLCITRPHIPENTDAFARRRYDTDQIAARTRPDDMIFVAPFGGWHYLFTGRRNATPYTAIFDDVYSVDQWPVAARAVLDRRPRLLILNEKLFGRLTAAQPRLKDIYFRAGAGYVLHDRRPGPEPPPGISFALTRRQGSKTDRLSPVNFRTAVGSARLGVSLPGPGPGDASREVAGSLDGDLLCIFDGADTYVGRLAPSGVSLDGEIFTGGRTVGFFTALPSQQPDKATIAP